MTFPKADLVIHPVRFRIMQTLMGRDRTTQEIADLLPDIPKSSIYRHIKLLLQGEMIDVAGAQLVHGIQEKRYRLAQRPYLGPADMAGMTSADHLRYFTVYILTVLQGFSDYLQRTEAMDGQVDMLADHTGYTEAQFYADANDLNEFQKEINELFLKFAEQGPGPGRRQHKFALITHLILEGNDGNNK